MPGGNSDKKMGVYKKVVAIITTFCGGVAGVFLVTGAGAQGLRLMVTLIFILCLLNVSVYLREFGLWLKKTMQTAGGHLAAPAVKETGEKDKPADNKDSKDGKKKADADRGDKKKPKEEDDDYEDEEWEEEPRKKKRAK